MSENTLLDHEQKFLQDVLPKLNIFFQKSRDSDLRNFFGTPASLDLGGQRSGFGSHNIWDRTPKKIRFQDEHRLGIGCNESLLRKNSFCGDEEVKNHGRSIFLESLNPISFLKTHDFGSKNGCFLEENEVIELKTPKKGLKKVKNEEKDSFSENETQKSTFFDKIEPKQKFGTQIRNKQIFYKKTEEKSEEINYSLFIKKNPDLLPSQSQNYFDQTPLNLCILKFLFGVVKTKDLEQNSFIQREILKKFIFDRFFKNFRVIIFKNSRLLKIIKNFFADLKWAKSQTQKTPNFEIKQIYKNYSEYLNHLVLSFQSQKLRQVTLGSIIIYLKNTFAAEGATEEISYLIISILLESVMIKLAEKFEQENHLVDYIETSADEILSHFDSILRHFKNNFLNDKKNVTQIENWERCEIFEISSFGLSKNQNFLDKHQIFLKIFHYLNLREGKDCVTRKKKSLWVKPKRDDERLKKIFKHVLQILHQKFINKKFSKKIFQSNKENYANPKNICKIETPKTQHSKNLTIETPVKEKSFLFTEARTLETKEHLSNQQIYLSNEELEVEFYKFYFGGISRNLEIPINNFFDPVKRRLVNKKFKSFTLSYFRLLLKSQKFRIEVQKELEIEIFMKK